MHGERSGIDGRQLGCDIGRRQADVRQTEHGRDSARAARNHITGQILALKIAIEKDTFEYQSTIVYGIQAQDCMVSDGSVDRDVAVVWCDEKPTSDYGC